MKDLKDLIIAELKKKGVNFKKSWYELTGSQQSDISDYCKQAKYKRPKSNMSSASTSHLFYNSLQRHLNRKKK